MNDTREAFEHFYLTILQGKADNLRRVNARYFQSDTQSRYQAFLAGRASMAKVPEPSRDYSSLPEGWGDAVNLARCLIDDDQMALTRRGEVSLAKAILAIDNLRTGPKDDRTDLAQRAVETKGIPDDTTLNQSAAALAGDGKREGTIPKDDIQADIGVDGQEPDGYFYEWDTQIGLYRSLNGNDTYNGCKPDRTIGYYLSPQPTPSIPAAQNTKDAERYRKLKAAITVPHAMQTFLKHMNWAPNTFSIGIDEAIDAYTLAAQPNLNTGHGHVIARPDGARARCGGPGICHECSKELAALKAAVKRRSQESSNE